RPGGRVTANRRPATVHDFGGFPSELFEFSYPAQGSPELAERVVDLLAPAVVQLDTGWGLDHGTWSALAHMYPEADIPVVQLGVDARLTTAEHYALGSCLRPLREDGILILGSGNVVHNLGVYAWDRPLIPPYSWAVHFDSWVRQAIMERRFEDVICYKRCGPDAALAVPTPEHYVPL
ncbi:class III extradiol ring-cleavage dioxygenase, partial [Mycobacterium sp.]|uniref:dioxygenase family protein n=1 Tax=Mycobacterium sp. TaxID=1785 RepID=UPI001287AE49